MIYVKSQKIECIEDKIFMILYGEYVSLRKTAQSVSQVHIDNHRLVFRLPESMFECSNFSTLEEFNLLKSQISDNVNPYKEKQKKTFFISGHRNLTNDEFIKYYIPKIHYAINNYDATFVIGEYNGCDIMAQDYLVNTVGYDLDKIIVYHMGMKPLFKNDKIIHLKGGYVDDVDRDNAMTVASDEDIAYVRDGEFTSGTAQNIIRRNDMSHNRNLI